MTMPRTARKMAQSNLRSAMNPQTRKQDSDVFIYDADLFQQADCEPTAEWFDPEWWEAQGAIASRERGRGTALVIETPVGRSVLRQYLRGGWAAKVIHSRYVFTGYENSRPLREFDVLQRLARLELPAPRPVAGYCQRLGLSYTGALITLEIENTTTIESVLEQMTNADWLAVGDCVRQFHDAGLVHADLTVRNILIQKGGRIYLVDFDRARFSPGADKAFQGNLQRLRRSLNKSCRENDIKVDGNAWTHLLHGYES